MKLDYSELGLKAGIEVHQQIDTSSKLFCRCKPIVRDDQPDVIVERKLRASAGEAGEVDVAAAYEQFRGKKYLYQAYNDNVCAVELDEEPVGDLNEDALYVCLQVAALLKAKPVDRVLVMRKTVVDGSNTSGFQRTALVARNGCIDSLSDKIGISTICIEEESAKIVERTADYDVYNLSRLGIPLIEIVTEADIKSPEELREVAEHIGMILRSTKRVKRGLGTIRQDINVSIRDGARVEIKGAQDLRLLTKLVENEVLRQKNLVDISTALKKQRAAVGKAIDITDAFRDTDSKLILTALEKREKIKAVKLKGFRGLVGREIQPGRRLGTELSDYAKAYGKVAGIIHSDELPKYGISEKEVERINKKLGCDEGDAFAFVIAEELKADIALKAVVDRADQAIKGLVKEVRKANRDGSTTYLRPMPGSERMYPETDTKPVFISRKVEKPALLSETAGNYQNLGLSKDLAHSIAKSGAEEFFELMVEENNNINPAFIAEIISSYPKEMERKQLDYSKINDDHLKTVFKALNKNEIAKESVIEILSEVAAGQSLDISKYKTISDSELEKELKKIVSDNNGMPFNAIIGKAMSKLRGKAPGKKIVDKLKDLAT